MPFDPETRYEVVNEPIAIRDFHAYRDEFVVRPPYQRKSVWTKKKQQALLDSLFRRFYVPRIVLRQVRLTNHNTLKEVIDGQQRIITAQLFLGDELRLPDTLRDIDPELPGANYSVLRTELKRFVDKLVYNADIIKLIEDPRDAEHQRIASEIFWRLQQGEELTYMEKAHARLSSLSRNFIVKYGDDISFDFERYCPMDTNSHKHDFFNLIGRKNDRMQHLALLTRLLILEETGISDIKDVNVMEYIDKYQTQDGVGNFSFEQKLEAQNVLRILKKFVQVFQNSGLLDEQGRLNILRTEYVIISLYLLLRHLMNYYVFRSEEEKLFREFVLSFYQRWTEADEDDPDIILFSKNRQQTSSEIETRHRIVRQAFFDYVKSQHREMLTKDRRRGYNEAERIAIYRRDHGLCHICLQEGKPESEARVPWNDFDADHVIPHSLGGETSIENARVLCRYHNRQRGDAVDSY